MLNKNFANLVTNTLDNSSTSYVGSYPLPLIDLSGNTVTTGNSNSYPAGYLLRSIFYLFNTKRKYSEIAGTSTSGTTFGFGSGNNADNDYDLETHIDDTNFTILSSTRQRNTDKDKLILTQQWEYTGTDEIVIREIGLFTNISIANNTNLTFMLDRTVLESPITVNNGDIFTIALTIGGKATVTVNS